MSDVPVGLTEAVERRLPALALLPAPDRLFAIGAPLPPLLHLLFDPPRGVDEAVEVLIFSGLTDNRLFEIRLQVKHVKIVEKLTIKAPEHYQTVADQNTAVTTSRFWKRMANIKLLPLHCLDVETV